MKAAVALVLIGCANPSPLDPPPPKGSPPTATMPIALDGRADEPDWDYRATRGAALDAELRLLRGDQLLYVFVDVRDRDIATSDHLELQIGTVALTLAPTTPSSATLGRTIAGTIDDPIDEDVGWRFELAIPIASLGPRPTELRATRCDAGTHPDPDRAPACGSWATTLEPTQP